MLPPGLAFVADAPGDGDSGAYDPATGIWTIGALGVGQTASRTITVRGVQLGSYVNLASLTGDPTPPDSNPTNNSDSANLSVVYPVADLAIVKTAFPQSVTVGDVVTYQLQASNLGPDPPCRWSSRTCSPMASRGGARPHRRARSPRMAACGRSERWPPGRRMSWRP